jgi:ATP-dependent helicase/DNAse subunit B
MTAHLYLAAAAAGKTTYVLNRVRQAARELQSTPRVVVPTHLQVRAWRLRLAGAGGTIGVRVLTFDRLYAECLNAAGEAYTELSEPVQYRLIRAVVDGLALAHYAPLVTKPGFIQVLQRLAGELKAARIHPDEFAHAVAGMGGEPRLSELAGVYAAYQERLQAQGWADRAGLGWLAVEALEARAPSVARDWPLLVVDGFDSFTSVQLAMLGVLAGRVGETLVTLTGTSGAASRPLVHRRFNRTRQRLEEAIGVTAAGLPQQASRHVPALAHLEAGLFRSDAVKAGDDGALELMEAPDRAAEVRAALRWLKARLVEDRMRLGDVALLARSVAPYRPFILQTAGEFGMPVRLLDGLPLRSNPAVTALLNLLRLVLPAAETMPEPVLPRRLVIEAWRSPYFDWSALPHDVRQSRQAPEPVGIRPEDADLLDTAARWGQVISGRSQWDEVLDALAALPGPDDPGDGRDQDEERRIPAGVPRGPVAQVLRAKFLRFLQRLAPPEGERSYRDFVGWLETLVGADPAAGSTRFPLPEESTSLKMVERVRAAGGEIADRDVAALQALKDILRGLVWAEEALDAGQAVSFPRFFEELAGAVEAVTYQLPLHPEREEILVADVVQARGVAFRAVAVLGLAEGEFPAAIGEDPFLRDADRRRLDGEFGLRLDIPTESAEAEFFYETVTRARERLLLTRPRLAENGALWQASPYWEQVRRLVRIRPQSLTSESPVPPEQAASWPELLESLARHPGDAPLRGWVRQSQPDRQSALESAVEVHNMRQSRTAGSPYDGDLTGLAGEFAHRFAADQPWSASRLETYRACPFFFFVGRVLNLEPQEEPAEGLDARQLGNIYHLILEKVYQAPSVEDPTDLDQLLAALPGAAGAVLDSAPQREGFRETAWWAQTREEIIQNVRRSLEALAELPGHFAPVEYEAAFGLNDRPPLVVHDGEDHFLLRGFIDRVDGAPGGSIRVIDYKTGGPSPYGKIDVARGKKLQLPLYALAARDALQLGEPVEGFYWHVRHAEPSGFTMSRFDGGPEAAMATAVEMAWEAVRSARDGHFVAKPPDGGCPAYCPAVAFCWHLRPGFWG